MDNIIFHLSTCSTCQKILKRIPKLKRFTLQDIKTNAISTKQLDALKKMAGSYEALFTRRSMKYRSMGLQDQELGEKDFRRLILAEYTFLKRPVMLVNGQLFIGNADKEVEGAIAAAKKME
ncbi:MAG: hypothetical protein KDC00_02375 [Flavobacteriales bacterium]|nr:hypothetical protein [Flavobacteriales bacterium]